MTCDLRRLPYADRLGSVKSRFHRKVLIDFASGCWLWIASVDNGGYGQMNVDGRPVKAHIISWRLYAGEVPAGLTLDHLCRVVRCVNPEHLELVTRAENTRRQIVAIGHPNSQKTSCPQGHLFDAINTRFAASGYGRVCRICRAASSRAYRARKKKTE